MGCASFEIMGLTETQAETFKLGVSAACRKMTTDQILDLADHLHSVIRKRAAHNVASSRAAFDHSVAHQLEERSL